MFFFFVLNFIYFSAIGIFRSVLRLFKDFFDNDEEK